MTRWSSQFADFHLRFASLFGNSVHRVRSAQYLVGLLLERGRSQHRELDRCRAPCLGPRVATLYHPYVVGMGVGDHGPPGLLWGAAGQSRGDLCAG